MSAAHRRVCCGAAGSDNYPTASCQTAPCRLQATSAALDNTSPRGATSRREKLQPNQRDPSFEFGNLTSQVGRRVAWECVLVVRCKTNLSSGPAAGV